MKIRRNDLYDKLWSEPVTEVAKNLNISAAEIRKLCKENKIPLPANGHWMKLKFGKQINIIPLDKTLDVNGEIEILEKTKARQTKVKQANIQPLLNTERYEVPGKLTNPDILIQEALKELKDREQYHFHDNLITLFDSVRIKASKKLFSRALRFMDALIKIFRNRGYDIEVKNRETYVIIRGEKIPISCREKIRRTYIQESYGQSAKDVPTGLLTFNIGGFYPKQWIDGGKVIEEQIPRILEILESEAERLKIWHLEIEENHKSQQVAALIEEEKENLKQKDLEDFVSLIKITDRFQKAKQMREYIECLNKKLNESNEKNEEVKEWIQWATKKINWYDPLLNSPDKNFQDIDKETLAFKKRSHF